MATDNRGTTPFDRLRSRYENVDMQCPDCGYRDEDGEWLSTTDGSQILYRHVCPQCGSVRKRTYTLREH